MFIGINGYTRPEDKYDALLPAVSSWTLDRRKKASKKNNFAGGFSASVNKNDEYRFYSINWDELPENDLAEDTTSRDVYESVSKPTARNTTIQSTLASVLYIVPIKFNIPANTLMWVMKSDNLFEPIQLTQDYVAGNASISIKTLKTTTITVTNRDYIVMHKTRGLGLLSLASLAATGSTHLMRDFMGNLVKVIFQSPKYNALGGTDEYNQMYFDVKMDFDIVSDTASNAYKITKGLQVNVTNENLPKVSSVGVSGGGYDLSSFFLRDDNYLNIMQLAALKSGKAYTLYTSSPIIPYMPVSNGNGGVPLLSMSRKIGVFRNFISTGNQMNLKFVGKDGAIIRDDADVDNELEFTMDFPEIIYAGTWNPNTVYGEWDKWDANTIYNAGKYVKDGNSIYVCIKEQTKGGTTADKDNWYKIPDGSPLVVSLESKFYNLITATSKGKNPKENASDWAVYNTVGTSITVKSLSKFSNNATKNDSLIFVIQPFTFQDVDKVPNKSSILLRIPIVDGPIIQDLDITDTATVTKLSSMYPTSDDSLDYSYLGNTTKLVNNTGFKYYQNSQLGSSVLAIPFGTSTAKSWSFTGELYTTRYNIEQCKYKLVNYTVLDIRGNAPTSSVINDGLTELKISGSNVHQEVTFRFARNYVPMKLSGSSQGTVNASTTLMQSINILVLNKKLVETILDPKPVNGKYKITQNVYWLVINPDYQNGLIVVKDEPSKSGLSVIKYKSSMVVEVSETSDTDATIKAAFTQDSANQYVDLASSITYDMEPLSQEYIAKFFGVEDNKWL